MRGSYDAPIPAWRVWLALILLFLVAGAIQGLVAEPVYRLCHAEPDLLLSVALSAALLSDPGIGASLGFVAGMLTASLVGQTLGTYLVSYTLAGYVAGRFTARLFQPNGFVIVLGVFVASAAAHVLQGLAAPAHLSLTFWLSTTLGGAAWNAVLAFPISSVLRRNGWGATS